MNLNPEIKKRWVDALRSGKYVQGKGALHRTYQQEGVSDTFCCWGVLCELAREDGLVDVRKPPTLVDSESVVFPHHTLEYYAADSEQRETDCGVDCSTALAPNVVLAWAGDVDLYGTVPNHPEFAPYQARADTSMKQTTLVNLNDSGAPFSVIADVIEREF